MDEEEERLTFLRKFGFIVEDSTRAVLIGHGFYDLSEVPLDCDSLMTHMANVISKSARSEGFDAGVKLIIDAYDLHDKKSSEEGVKCC